VGLGGLPTNRPIGGLHDQEAQDQVEAVTTTRDVDGRGVAPPSRGTMAAHVDTMREGRPWAIPV